MIFRGPVTWDEERGVSLPARAEWLETRPADRAGEAALREPSEGGGGGGSLEIEGEAALRELSAGGGGGSLER